MSKKRGFEEYDGDLVIRIKQFEEYVEISKSQRKQYKKDEKGNFIDYVYREEQSADDMFRILGYNKE